jgi:hypothetical protein
MFGHKLVVLLWQMSELIVVGELLSTFLLIDLKELLF